MKYAIIGPESPESINLARSLLTTDFPFQMPGPEIYELWLRTGWADPGDWLEFLCEGEGVFGDCNTDRGTGGLALSWPGETDTCGPACDSQSLTLNHQAGQ